MKLNFSPNFELVSLQGIWILQIKLLSGHGLIPPIPTLHTIVYTFVDMTSACIFFYHFRFCSNQHPPHTGSDCRLSREYFA